MGKPSLCITNTFLDKCRMFCLTVEIILNIKIISHTLKLQHKNVITPHFNDLKIVVFANVNTLQANKTPKGKVP